MTFPLARPEGPVSLNLLIYQRYLRSDPEAVTFSEICEKAADTLGLCSTFRLKTSLSALDAAPFSGRERGVNFAPVTFETLLNLPCCSRTEGYRETAERVRYVERFIEEAVQNIVFERRAVKPSCPLEQQREQITSTLCGEWFSIFQVERGGRPWRILEEQKALWKDVSLIEKIEKTEAYKEAHRKMLEAIYERYLCLAEVTITKNHLGELGKTQAEVSGKRELAPKFFDRLRATRTSYFSLDNRGAALEGKVEEVTRSRTEVLVKEKVRITGEEADKEIKKEGLGLYSKVIEGAVKNIFNAEEINNEIHRARFEVSFFKWEEKKVVLKEWGEGALIALRGGFFSFRRGDPLDMELFWRSASYEVRCTWEEFPCRLNEALKMSLSSDKLFDEIKKNIVVTRFSSDWNLQVPLETILISFLKQGFSEALEFVRKKALSVDSSVVGDLCIPK